jgi:hypothetical protein
MGNVVRLPFIAVFGLWISTASAADIQSIEIPGTRDAIIHMKGEIVAGDAVKFRGITRQFESASVFLDSPGGLVDEGLEIGEEIRFRQFATVVVEECYSICGVMWLAGVRKYMTKHAKIGFHAAYWTGPDGKRESGVANAVIGAYLTKWGYRVEAVAFVASKGPDEISILSPDMARVLGIEMFTEDGEGFKPPTAEPTADMYAEYHSIYRFMERMCGKLFQAELPAIRKAYDDAARSGIALVGEEKWAELLWPYMESGVGVFREKGGVQVCLGLETWLRERSLPTGVEGPSFPCSSAATQTERAICWDPYLWAKDRATTAIFFHIRGVTDKSLRKRMLADQRAWLQERNACSGDKACLHTAYDNRLKAFRDVNVDSASA